MKRTLGVWVLALLLGVLGCAGGVSAAYAEEAATLIRNGGAEIAASGSGQPDGWAQDVYTSDAGGAAISTLTVGQDGGHSGQAYLSVSNASENDARWIQEVPVEADTVYRLSGWIRVAGGLADRTGGNLSVLGIAAPFPAVGDSQGEWRQVEWYGKTGADQTSVTVAARLGSYGSLNSGKADFDDIALEKLAEAPAGAVVIPLWPEAYAGAASGGESAGGGHGTYTAMMFLLAAAYAALAWGIVSYLRRAGEARLPIPGKERAGKGAVLLLFGGALLIRAACAPIMQGHPIDALDFYFWANHAYEAGLHGFYTADIFVDYPPGYIYVLYVVGLLQKLMHIGYPSAGSALLLKLPSIAADLAASYVLLRIARPRFGAAAGAAIASLYLFNPMVFHNSVVWGQIDSFLSLFILLAVWAIAAGRLPYATAAVVVAVLIKPQAIVAIPVLLLALAVRRSRRAWGESLLYGAAVFVLLVLPFSIHQSPDWIVERYKAMFDSYPYATLNAANLYGLLGLNGVKVSAAMAFWSNLSVVLIVAYIVWLAWRHRKLEAAPRWTYLAYLTFLLVFALKTSMHERYGYPAVALALLAFILLKDRRLLWMFLGLTFTHFADAAYVLYFGLDKNYYLSATDGFFRFLSLVNLAISIYAVYVGWTLDKGRALAAAPVATADSARGGKGGVSSKSASAKNALSKSTPAKPAFATAISASDAKFSRLDRLLVIGLTLVYGILALVNLGSMRAPESGWTPASPASAIVYDFGEPQAVASVIWFGGTRDEGRAEDSTIELSQSADGSNWTSALSFVLNGGSVFQWKEQPVAINQRFVRVSASNPGWTLYELSFRDAEGGTLTPAKTSEGGTALLDEPGDVPKKPSYLNSMYFDEIYHGRTAYEFLHHIEPYETTHPPLGKGLMALGVSLFGMNPFGWRIMGTLLGIAMVPLMYLLAKRMFGRTELAFAAAFLLTFDFMHFTQTRIATVDVYGVFFILLMYLYMYKYYERALAGESFRRVAVPLALAGLFFGLGAASKWIDIYAGGGLAVLFAITLWRRRAEHSFLLRTVLWCVPFFLVVPALIYTASYIPFFLVPGPGHGFHDMLTYQKFMYNYHAHLVATHPFASSWWEWPLMIKPIWYYGGAVAADQVSSIVAMGNPAVWWIGIPAVAGAIILLFKGRARDPRLVFLLIGLAAEYLPWVGVSRLTFIYHFFASVPFIILLIVYLLKEGKESGRLTRGHVYGYLGATLLLFVLFYPILSGMTVDKSYVVHALRWFNSWIFNG
ncbi:phospholipid carrier-dependent glycosyltransferase [Cohnella hashimotonis]|uniref:Polyprenol-phosphate-mannose--protein mannosyltransferase n=1 Tax=Cohnella hashimotonis TaxID=2826895 RepID=A0ABT6TCL3_9BACL|nr:phospholipid carrier-dependent glycosyltransferase [Cohnella hashimotonis]MDI4644048.1 phospholipid carrier-dependent glycosyltransferase [Cohnella hashimotonis]